MLINANTLSFRNGHYARIFIEISFLDNHRLVYTFKEKERYQEKNN